MGRWVGEGVGESFKKRNSELLYAISRVHVRHPAVINFHKYLKVSSRLVDQGTFCPCFPGMVTLEVVYSLHYCFLTPPPACEMYGVV